MTSAGPLAHKKAQHYSYCRPIVHWLYRRALLLRSYSFIFLQSVRYTAVRCSCR